ncbi:MAG: thioredoxin family protein [Bacteroidales bacterium]
MEIKVLGSGCPKCRALEKATQDAAAELGLEASIVKEEDIMKIMEYGILRTPGLVINEKVVASGRVPSSGELKQILTQNQ